MQPQERGAAAREDAAIRVRVSHAIARSNRYMRCRFLARRRTTVRNFIAAPLGAAAIALGAGCSAPADTEASATSTDALGITDLFGDFKTAISIAEAANSVLEWEGIYLFGPAQPSNQDILDQVNALSGQVALVNAKLDTVLDDLTTLQISLQTVSDQVVKTSVDQRLADMSGAMAGIQTYSYEVANGQPTDAAAPALLSDQTVADVEFFKLPEYYQQLMPNGTTAWTPLFAVIPYIKAVSIRAVFLGSFFPTSFRSIPGVVAELHDDATFARTLATKTAAWGVSQCTVTTKYVCASGHYEVEWINGKPHRLFECDQENDSYTASCPTTYTSKSGFGSIAAANVAGQAALPMLYPTMKTNLGVDGLNALAANLDKLAGP
jgi:hypothetical protein